MRKIKISKFLIFSLFFVLLVLLILQIGKTIMNQNPYNEERSLVTEADIKKNFIRLKINDLIIDAELAYTPSQREIGLMNRTVLDEYSGMLFVFDREEPQSFWMKNTLIPLELLFIDKDNTIVEIMEMDLCDTIVNDNGNKVESCKIYTSSKPVKYALELNSNFSLRHDIKIGDKIERID